MRNGHKIVGIGEGIFKDFNMTYTDILEGSAFLIRKSIVDLVQCIKSFDDMPKDGVFTIKIVDIVGKSDEELRATSWRIYRRDSHGKSAFVSMFERIEDFGGKVSGWPGTRRGLRIDIRGE